MTKNWVGPTADNNWATTTNWSTGSIPTNADTARLDNGGTILINQTGTVSRFIQVGAVAPASGGLGGTLLISSGAGVLLDDAAATTGGELNLATTAASTAWASMTGGTLNIARGSNAGNTANGDLTVVDGAANANATFAQSGGTLTVGDGFILSAASGATNSNATVDFSGGTATVQRGIFIGGGAGNGTFLMSQADSGVPTSLKINVTSRADGQFGLVIANNSDTNGVMRISGGTLSVLGQVSLGSSLAQPSGVSNNNGTLIVHGSAATITVGGQLSTDGGGNSGLTFEIGNTGISRVSVTGAANLNGAFIDLDTADGFVPTGETFDVLSAASITGAYSLVLDGDAFDAYQLRVVDGGSGVILQAYLPEPGALMGVTMMVGCALLRRRRRARHTNQSTASRVARF